MENSNISPSAVKEFERAVNESLKPLAKEFGFGFEQIDPRLFALTAEPITIKVYFPECHGYDVDVKVAPTFSREWYSPQEKSIDWVGPFLGLGEFITSRATSEAQIAQLVKVNAEFLHQALPSLRSLQMNFWDDLALFIQEQISKEEEHDGQSTEEQRVSEVRQKIEVAWRSKDFAQVISLLEEIEGKMTAAETKKLEYARKHIA